MKAYKAMGEEKQEIQEVIMKIVDICEETEDLYMFINALLNVLGRLCVDLPKDKFLGSCEKMYDLHKDSRTQ